MIKRSLLAAAFAIVAIAPAHAEYFTHYTITITGSQAVDGIVKWERDALGNGGVSWPDSVNGGSVNFLDQIFPSFVPRTSAFFLGMSYDPDTGPDAASDHIYGEQLTPEALALIPIEHKHLVMFLNNNAASQLLLGGLDFDTLFPGFTESDVIGWLEIVGQIGTPPTDEAVFDADVNLLSTLVDYADLHYGAYFAIPPNQQTVSGQFSVIRFSSATEIGSGSTSQDYVPEPGTFSAMTLAGLGLLAFRRYRHG